MSDDTSEDHQASPSGEPGLSQDEENDSVSLTGSQGSGQQANPRKRKSSAPHVRSLARAKKSSQYRSEYQKLLNATIEEIAYPFAFSLENSRLRTGRIGLTTWTTQEKEAFFIALDRKGRQDIKQISKLVGTKSESEVKEFLLALQDAYVEEHEQIDRSNLLDYSEIPSAFEVSKNCEAALETAADGLAERQSAIEVALEKTRHGQNWLLDASTVESLELTSDEAAPGDILVNALELLDVSAMIYLSSNFFMNSRQEDGNWRSYVEDECTPGLFATAFLDLYNLVIGITRRVICSAIFLATSRHNQQYKFRGINNQPAVKQHDVQAACELLGLRNDWKEYWKHVARRCNLDVYQTAKSRTPMHLEEVERNLAGVKDNSNAEISSRSSSGDDSIVGMSSIALRHEGQYLADEEEDKRAEYLDSIQNQEEEARLWNMIGKPDECHIKIEDRQVDMLRPRRRGELVKDWQDRINYKAEWQLSEGFPSPMAFYRQKKRQKVQLVEQVDSPSSQPSTLSLHSENSSPAATDSDADGLETTGIVHDTTSSRGEPDLAAESASIGSTSTADSEGSIDKSSRGARELSDD